MASRILFDIFFCGGSRPMQSGTLRAVRLSRAAGRYAHVNGTGDRHAAEDLVQASLAKHPSIRRPGLGALESCRDRQR